MTAVVWLGREFQACWAIARQAYLMRASSGGNRVSWMVLFLVLMLGGASFIATGGISKAMGVAIGMPLVMLGLLWWSYLIASVRLQCHAAGLALVPGMRARCLAVLLFGWLVLTSVLGIEQGYFVGNYGIAFFLVSVLLATTAAATLAPGLLLFLLLLAGALYVLGKLLPPASVGFTLQGSDNGKLLVAVLLVCALVVMRHLGPPRAKSLLLAEIKLLVFLFYARSLQRDCVQGDRRALLMHALGPGATFKTWLMQIILGLALLVGSALYAGMPLPVLRVLVVSAAIALQYAVAGRLFAAVYARHKEQGLLRLAANAPAAKRLNDWLAHGLLQRFAKCWLLITLSALSLNVLLGGVPERLLPLFAVMCMPVLAGGMLLRDYARREHHRFSDKAIVAAWYLLTFVLLLLATTGKLPAGWAGVIAGAILLAGWALVARRKQAMLRAPAGFPAGRMP